MKSNAIEVEIIQKAIIWGVRLFERQHFVLSVSEREECFGVACLKICEVISRKPNQPQKFYEIVGLNAVRNYFRKPKINVFHVENIDDLNILDTQSPTEYWLDDLRLEKVADLLQKTRIKGGRRAQNALYQELMVLAHVFDGWSTPLIAEEMNLSQDAVKKIRIRIIKRLEKLEPEKS